MAYVKTTRAGTVEQRRRGGPDEGGKAGGIAALPVSCESRRVFRVNYHHHTSAHTGGRNSKQFEEPLNVQPSLFQYVRES